MFHNLIYIVLAAFGLGFLIFIHELGHYFVARRTGMKVEAFGIGFGKPIYTWERKGVKWNVCWIPFGGYVRIAGMEKEGPLEPHQIKGGFYASTPMSRIKVAVTGPLVNIVFALFAFTLIWMAGGREKPFSDFTHLIGWIDPQSKLHELGVHPGDQIQQYAKRPFEGFEDLKYTAIVDEKSVEIKGEKIDYFTQAEQPFDYNLETYRDPRIISERFSTIGVLSPASYLIYMPGGAALPEGAPIADSGIQPQDRIVWVDGQIIFSQPHLSAVINEGKSLLTVQRGPNTFLTRIPRLKANDLRMTPESKAELDDWQHEAGLNLKLNQLYFIPYDLNNAGVVEGQIAYINEESEEHLPSQFSLSPMEAPLMIGDKIIAVDGVKVSSALELLTNLQKKKVQLIVQRGGVYPPIPWKKADEDFISSLDVKNLKQLISRIGTDEQMSSSGPLYLLSPVEPKPVTDFAATPEILALNNERYNAQKKEIEKISDPAQQAASMRILENGQKRLVLGIAPQPVDRNVIYNPSPFRLFGDVFEQTGRTLKALFTGSLNPKWMSGPVGIVQVMHYGWTVGVKEVLYWMAVISLNLGILNLLPLPVLDGGHICFSLYEMCTKRRIKSKTMEKLVLPFVILLIGFFIYVTYNDLARLFTRFF